MRMAKLPDTMKPECVQAIVTTCPNIQLSLKLTIRSRTLNLDMLGPKVTEIEAGGDSDVELCRALECCPNLRYVKCNYSGYSYYPEEDFFRLPFPDISALRHIHIIKSHFNCDQIRILAQSSGGLEQVHFGLVNVQAVDGLNKLLACRKSNGFPAVIESISGF